MRTWSLILLAAAVGVIASVIVDGLMSFAHGQPVSGAVVAATPSFKTVLAGLALEAVQIASPILLAWLALKLNQWFGLNREAELRASLQTALENGSGKMVQAAGSAAQALVFGTASRNKALAEGLAYVEQAAPDAIKHFGLTRDALIEKLEAKLGLALAAQGKPGA